METKTKISPIAAKVQAALQALPEKSYSFKKAPVLTIEGVEHTVVSVTLVPGNTLRFGFAKNDPCGYASVDIEPEVIDNISVRMTDTESPDRDFSLILDERKEDHLDFVESLRSVLNLVLDERNRDRADSICSIAVRIAELLWKDGGRGDIAFDPRSYDNPDDMPHLVIYGKRHDIVSLNISKDGGRVTATTYDRDTNTYRDYTFCTDFACDTDRELADNVDDHEAVLEKMGVRDLLCDAYYETEESWEIGDFETDFLKIR